MDWAETIDNRSNKTESSKSSRWRFIGLVSGGLGTLSLFLPYVRVSSEDILGFDVGGSFGIAQVATLIAENDPVIANLLLIGAVGGSVLALAGAIFSIYLVFLGGLLMTGTGGILVLSSMNSGSSTAGGLVEVSLSVETGLIVLLIGGLVALSTLFIE